MLKRTTTDLHCTAKSAANIIKHLSSYKTIFCFIYIVRQKTSVESFYWANPYIIVK